MVVLFWLVLFGYSVRFLYDANFAYLQITFDSMKPIRLTDVIAHLSQRLTGELTG